MRDYDILPKIIEQYVYIERVYRDNIYQRGIYLYLPTALAVVKRASIIMKIVARIKQHANQITRVEKRFLTKILQYNVNPLPWLYGMITTHKTPWATRPIISCTGSLVNPIGVWTDCKFQQVAADMSAYFNN